MHQLAETHQWQGSSLFSRASATIVAKKVIKQETAETTSPPHLDVFFQFGFRALKIFTFCDGGWVARVARIRHGAGETQSRREEINATLHNQVSAPTMPGSLAPTAAAQPLIGR